MVLSYDDMTTPTCPRGNGDVCTSSIDRKFSFRRSSGMSGMGRAVFGTKSTFDSRPPTAPSGKPSPTDNTTTALTVELTSCLNSKGLSNSSKISCGKNYYMFFTYQNHIVLCFCVQAVYLTSRH